MNGQVPWNSFWLIPNEDKNDAYAKEKWTEWFAWEVSKSIDTVS